MAANPGSVRAESIRFLESAGNIAGGNAGTWTGTFNVPDGATLVDVIVHGAAVWTATTSATLTVGDVTDPDGVFAGVNLKATDLLAGESISMNGLAGGKHGADLALDYTSVATIGASQIKRRATQALRSLTASVVTVGTPVTTRPGDTTVTFIYAYASPMTPTFVTA